MKQIKIKAYKKTNETYAEVEKYIIDITEGGQAIISGEYFGNYYDINTYETLDEAIKDFEINHVIISKE